MNFESLIQQVTVLAIPLLLAITLSEAARGRMAYWLGDKTGFIDGRITWNPMNHVSPVATVIVPIVMFVVTQGAFIFGGAKPIPIDSRNLRDPRQGAILIELASPVALVAMALFWFLIYGTISIAKIEEAYFNEVAKAGVFVCVSLFAFQLLPIPPLSGGRILMLALPPRYSLKVAFLEPWGIWIIVLLAIAGVLVPFWMSPITELCLKFLQLVTAPVFYLFT